MSRCFPFPPPGYEKKSRAEDADLLKKEKSKEKKHKKDKKEKKDKEKKEGKEKRDKDKSDDKRREKKDKKKDRDKKKDKEKEKAHTSEESRPSRNVGSQNGEDAVRIKHNSVQEEKHAGQFDSYDGTKINQNTFLSKETKNSKLVSEAGRRIEDCGTAKVEKFAVAQSKRADGMDTQVSRSSETLFEAKEPNKNKKIDERKYNGQGIRNEERFSGNSGVPSCPSLAAIATASATASGNFETLFEAKEQYTNKKIDEKKYNGQGIRHEERFIGNSAVPSLAATATATATATASGSSETLFEAKEPNKNKKIDERKYNGQGIRHEERFCGNSAVPSFPSLAATATATASGSSETLFEAKEPYKKQKIDEKKYNGQGIRHEERFSENSAVPSFPSFAATASGTGTATATVESGVAGMFKPLEKSTERGKETSDKIGQKGEEKRGTKHKDRDKEKKGRSRDKEKKKEKKAKEKAKERVEEKNGMVDKAKEIRKDNLLDIHSANANTSQLPDSNIGAAVEENLNKKRKYFEPNGLLHAIDNRSTKLLKPTSHPLKENGWIVEPTLPPSETQAVANDLISVSKEIKVNGIIEAPHLPASSKHKSSRQDDHPKPTAVPKKSPHPDLKYLNVVYSVPKMEELSDSDNQDWLFSSNTAQAMKPELKASETEEMPQVWAEAMQVESADVYALPYVIPY